MALASESELIGRIRLSTAALLAGYVDARADADHRQEIDRWYFGFNPTFDRSLHGPSVSRGFEFSPNVKVSYKIFRRGAAGLEYYGSYGPIGSFDSLQQQQHQLVPSLELDLPHRWELDVGYAFGLTPGTKEQVLKVIVGRCFGGKDKD